MSDILEKRITLLQRAYAAELETVANYVANSIMLDGVRADPIKAALSADVQEELGHALQIGNRLKTIGGTVPGSLELRFAQRSLQPPKDTTDVVNVIRGVIEAENEAITNYLQLVKVCEGVDYVTQDLCITLMGQEENHRRQFEGFLKEYTK